MSILTRLQCVRIVDGTGKCQANRKMSGITGKDRIGITPKRLKAFIHAGLRVSSRARKKQEKQEKTNKNPLPKPGLWATSTLLACQGIGTPPLRGGSPFLQIVAPEGASWPPNTGLQPAPRALLDGRAAPGSPLWLRPLARPERPRRHPAMAWQ